MIWFYAYSVLGYIFNLFDFYWVMTGLIKFRFGKRCNWGNLFFQFCWQMEFPKQSQHPSTAEQWTWIFCFLFIWIRVLLRKPNKVFSLKQCQQCALYRKVQTTICSFQSSVAIGRPISFSFLIRTSGKEYPNITVKLARLAICRES